MGTGSVPFEATAQVRDACLCLHLQRSARAVARRFDEALRSLDLTNGQFSLLMALNRPKPASMGDVAELLAIDRTTLTAALKPLERRGLVRIQSDVRDRRVRRLHLAPEGIALLAAALPVWRDTHVLIERSFENGEADRLRAELRQIERG